MKSGMVVKKHTQDRHYFDLLAADGLVLCRSEAYAAEEACMAAIAQLREACSAPVEDQTLGDYKQLDYPKYEMFRNHAGQYSFLLKDSEGAVLARGPVFLAAYTCRQGITQVSEFAPGAELIVLTHEAKPLAYW